MDHDGRSKRERLDNVLVARRLAHTRSQAQHLIRAGHVRVNGETVTRSSTRVADDAHIVVHDPMPFVGRGGLKLRAALERFRIDVRGIVALDVGSSTGGFTDCLLQAGASRVYAVDVGHEQLAPTLREDPRVRLYEGTDIRALPDLPDPIDLAVVDVSFISLRHVLPAIERFLRPGTAQVIALIKPQFETGERRRVKHGVLRDPAVRRQVVYELLQWAETQGWRVIALMRSPILGAEGNVEYLAHILPPGTPPTTPPEGFDALLAPLFD